MTAVPNKRRRDVGLVGLGLTRTQPHGSRTRATPSPTCIDSLSLEITEVGGPSAETLDDGVAAPKVLG
jgi:hypothetical protein